MTTQQYITWLQRQIGDQYTRELLRETVNLAQNEVLAQRGVELQRIKPVGYLATTAATYTYTLPTNIRKVSRIYLEESSSDSGYIADQFGSSGYKVTREFDKGLNRYCQRDLDFEQHESLRYGDPVILYFPPDQDLGDTTTTYRMQAYAWPPQVTSESVPLSLPEPFLTGMFYHLIKGKVEEAAYGQDIYNDPKFLRELGQFTVGDANSRRMVTPQRKVRF